MKKKLHWSPPGMRIIKSVIAVMICYIISILRGNSGIVFYSQLAALWCIQMYRSNTMQNAIQRTCGTLIGTLFGLIYILMKSAGSFSDMGNLIFEITVTSLMIGVVLYTTVLLKLKQASYFSCVVFLSIAVNHVGDVNPYLFVWNRFWDTMIGIMIGISINRFSLPTVKRKDVLFISGVDDILVDGGEKISDYSKVELNRMLDEGINFTLSTMRTPASLCELMKDIRLKLPVIAMDGAVLYDMNSHSYLKSYTLSKNVSELLLNCIAEQGFQCFVNCVIDDTLIIFYDEDTNDIRRDIMQELRKSPYRNYIKKKYMTADGVVYVMVLYEKEKIEQLYQCLCVQEFWNELKVLKYDSCDYPGYGYLKIYHKDATRENMNQCLLSAIGAKEIVTFGSIPDKHDVYIPQGNVNKVVRELKKKYEPLKILGS